jgi:hypothetical protein
MSDEEVITAKKDMVAWVRKEIMNDTFGLVYQVLYQMKKYFDDLEDSLLTPEQRQKRAQKELKKRGIIKV